MICRSIVSYFAMEDGGGDKHNSQKPINHESKQWPPMRKHTVKLWYSVACWMYFQLIMFCNEYRYYFIVSWGAAVVSIWKLVYYPLIFTACILKMHSDIYVYLIWWSSCRLLLYSGNGLCCEVYFVLAF